MTAPRPTPAVLPTPVLDDRDFDQLLAELRDRIPVYTPEWTDLGPSDPGVTLLELVAHLGEVLLFRFNQIPDQTRLWLLRLLQLPPYPPRRATGLVAFTAEQAAGPPPEVPLGTAVRAGAVAFRVGADVTVLPATVTAAVKAIAPAPADPVLHDEYLRVLDANDLDEATATPYTETVLVPGMPGSDRLDVSTAADRCLWVAVHPPDGAPGTLADQRLAFLDPAGPLAKVPLVLGVATAAERPTIDDVTACEGAVAATGTTAGPIWQATTEDGGYVDVVVVRDTTEGMRHDGVLALRLPSARLPGAGGQAGAGAGPGPIGLPDVEDEDLAGVGDRPPALADGPPVLFWLRAFPRRGTPEIGVLRWVGLNAAEVEQVTQASPEILGRGQGLGGQELALTGVPVVPGSLQVQVQEDGETWTPWEVVESFAASTAGDRHLVLDAAAGRVRCGDSVRGRVLPAGAAVRAAAYRFGGGRAGNLAAGAITAVPDVAGVRVTNPLATSGGEEAETITRALERIPGELSRHDRAVVADDFRELATVPGVGRAECLPRFDPATRATDAAGVVTVVVWPAEDPSTPDAPAPDAALLRAVCERLDARRLVTTELYVVPPTYHPVVASVGLAVKPGHSAIGVRRWVELVLRQYLAPLPPYGPDGRGWPLGRAVYGPELQAAVLQVEGVEFVEDLLVADGADPTTAPGLVTLAAWEVPRLTALAVVVGTPPDPRAPSPSPADPDPDPPPTPVPVPVPRSEC